MVFDSDSNRLNKKPVLKFQLRVYRFSKARILCVSLFYCITRFVHDLDQKPRTERALPYLNHLLDILPVNNVYRFHTLKFTHLWHKGLPPNVFDNLFQYSISRHTYCTRYASQKNLCKQHPRTNMGKPNVLVSGNRSLARYSSSRERSHYIFLFQRNQTLFAVRTIIESNLNRNFIIN